MTVYRTPTETLPIPDTLLPETAVPLGKAPPAGWFRRLLAWRKGLPMKWAKRQRRHREEKERMWRVATLSKGQMFLYKNDPIANQDFKIFVCFLPLCWMGSYTGMEAWLELHRWIDKRTCELANKTWEGATREKDDIALREGYLEVERVKKRLNEIS